MSLLEDLPKQVPNACRARWQPSAVKEHAQQLCLAEFSGQQSNMAMELSQQPHQTVEHCLWPLWTKEPSKKFASTAGHSTQSYSTVEINLESLNKRITL